MHSEGFSFLMHGWMIWVVLWCKTGVVPDRTGLGRDECVYLHRMRACERAIDEAIIWR